MLLGEPPELRRCCEPCDRSDSCDARLVDRWAAEAERRLGRRRAGLALDRFDAAVAWEVVRAGPERLVVVGLAALDRERAVALELRAGRVVEPLLCEPLGLAPLCRDRLDVDRRLLELLDVVERSAMALLVIHLADLGVPLAHRGSPGLRVRALSEPRSAIAVGRAERRREVRAAQTRSRSVAAARVLPPPPSRALRAPLPHNGCLARSVVSPGSPAACRGVPIESHQRCPRPPSTAAPATAAGTFALLEVALLAFRADEGCRLQNRFSPSVQSLNAWLPVRDRSNQPLTPAGRRTKASSAAARVPAPPAGFVRGILRGGSGTGKSEVRS
jgi:hypothetical protein